MIGNTICVSPPDVPPDPHEPDEPGAGQGAQAAGRRARRRSGAVQPWNGVWNGRRRFHGHAVPHLRREALRLGRGAQPARRPLPPQGQSTTAQPFTSGANTCHPCRVVGFDLYRWIVTKGMPINPSLNDPRRCFHGNSFLVE